MFTCYVCKLSKDSSERTLSDERDNINLCRECKSKKYKKYYSENKRKIFDQRNVFGRTKPGIKASMLKGARRRAKEKGVPCTLQSADLPDIPDYCPILQTIKLQKGEGKMTPASPSLDRIDPKLGYVPGNVQIISSRANTLKNDGSIEELTLVLEWMKSYKNG